MFRRCCTGRCIWFLIAFAAFGTVLYVVSLKHSAQVYSFSFHNLYNNILKEKSPKISPKFKKYNYPATFRQNHQHVSLERKQHAPPPHHTHNTNNNINSKPSAFAKQPLHSKHQKQKEKVTKNIHVHKKSSTTTTNITTTLPNNKPPKLYYHPNHNNIATQKSTEKKLKQEEPHNPPLLHIKKINHNQEEEKMGRNVTTAYSDVAKENPHLLPGGRYKPRNHPRQKVAIIIPVRNEWIELRLLLHYLHPILRRQNLEYGIFVINQARYGHFSKGKLLNIGFKEVSKLDHGYHCFVFHDVDVLPENYRCTYTCSDGPRYISTAVSKHRYRYSRYLTIGQVSSFTSRHMRAINGWSNILDGWRAEENMARRIRHKHLKFWRSSSTICRFTSLPHVSGRMGQHLHPPRSSSHKMDTDGLNSLKYKHIKTQLYATYTQITVEEK